MRSRVMDVDARNLPGSEMPYTNGTAYKNQSQGSAGSWNGAAHGYRPPAPEPSKAERRWSLVPAEGWLALVLLGIALYCVVGSISAANWVERSNLLFWSPAAGLLIGFVIAKTPRFPQSVLHLAACLAGHWLAVWLTCTLAFHMSWMLLLTSLRDALTGHMAGLDVQANQAIFFFYLVFLCFFLGYFGSWLIYRARLPWLVALVYCSILLVNLNYVKTGLLTTVPLIVGMVGALLLLIARLHLAVQISRWKQEGLYTDRQWLSAITGRCMQIATVMTLGMLVLATLSPILEQPDNGRQFWDRTASAWNNLLSGRLSMDDLTGLSPFGGSGQNFFSDRLTINNNISLPRGEVLTYQNQRGNNQLQPHYLESFAYNEFDGRTWTSSESTPHSYSANEALIRSETDGQVKITMVHPPGGTKNYVFAPDLPVTFSRPVVIYSDTMVSAWTTVQPFRDNESYEVAFSSPTNSDALTLFPLPKDSPSAWEEDFTYRELKQHYLKVPGDLTSNVRATMAKWTRGAPNAYKALQQIEQHFRDTKVFTYSLDNPAIPANTDVVDWLLQNKQGYCTHYATAMAIMGRQLGIPTRIMNGFSQGHFDQQRKVWVVDGTDAHSWVQAYFPGYGWSSFDPTPGFAHNAAPTPQTGTSGQATPTVQPATPTPKPQTTPHARATATAQAQKPGQSGGENKAVENGVGNEGLWLVASIVLIVLALLFCIFAMIRYWWRRLYIGSTLIAGLFWRFCKIASLLGLAPQSWQTPYEYSWKLGQRYPAQAKSVWRLTELFVRDRWGAAQHLPRERELVDAEQHWRALRGLFWSLLLNRVRRKS